MKKVLIALIGGTAMSVASLAQAADLPYRKSAPANYDYPPTFTWTGFYVGGNVGAGFGDYTGGTNYFGRSPVGGAFGATAGYNFQSGNLLVGAEGDFDWSHIADAANPAPTASSSGSVKNLMTIRGRVGYAWDRALFFGTAGYAGANTRGELSGTIGGVATGYDQSRFASGFALGAGVEYALTPHISAKGEYLYTSFGNNNYFGNGNTTAVGANISLLRAGLNYKF